MSFLYSRPVHLYETDLMGVVHHSNYVRYMEEARFEWLRQENLVRLHGTDKNCVFAVIEMQTFFKSPLKWGEHFEVELNVIQKRIRFQFDAIIRIKDQDKVAFTGSVVLVCVNNQLQPMKPPRELMEFFEKEKSPGVFLSSMTHR